MKALKRYKTTFWGQLCLCRPMLLDRVWGDGREWVWFEYMDDRPDFYVARVPTGTLEAISARTDKWYDCLMAEIEGQIDDEAKDFYSERNWREHDKKGYVYNSRKWPIPPFQACGSAWGEYEPSETILKANAK